MNKTYPSYIAALWVLTRRLACEMQRLCPPGKMTGGRSPAPAWQHEADSLCRGDAVTNPGNIQFNLHSNAAVSAYYHGA